MKKKSKYQRKHQKSRDCTKCKRYDGFISKNYFVCKYDEDIKDILDRDVLKKGTCSNFMPKEVRDQDDSLHVNDAVERTQQEDDQAVSRKE